MVKNYKLLLIMIVCFMFPISCNIMSTQLSARDLGKVPVDITTICTKLAASGEDGLHVCTCDKGNKPFCLISTILTPELIGRALRFYFVKEAKKFKRIMRDKFLKKYKFCEESTK